MPRGGERSGGARSFDASQLQPSFRVARSQALDSDVSKVQAAGRALKRVVKRRLVEGPVLTKPLRDPLETAQLGHRTALSFRILCRFRIVRDIDSPASEVLPRAASCRRVCFFMCHPSRAPRLKHVGGLASDCHTLCFRSLGQQRWHEVLQPHVNEATDGSTPWEEADKNREWRIHQELNIVAHGTRKRLEQAQLATRGRPRRSKDASSYCFGDQMQ